MVVPSQVYAMLAVFAVILLVIRRQKYGAELGGPKKEANAWSVVFVALWLTYVGASAFGSPF